MENVRYYFILGSNPALSASELAACFGEKNLTPAGEEVILYETGRPIDAPAAIRRLGGTIKIGRVLAETSPNDLLAAIKPLLEPGEGKFHFGFSGHGVKPALIKPLAMEVKKELKARGVSARWVVSREPTLSSVVVEQNRLTTGGAEFVLIARAGKILVGRTLAVQAWKELSHRDYGRPARDDRSGMLPPKLAQIMLNLARAPKDGAILDPFCGSGTILAEAALMGYPNLLGSDISPKAVADTKKNIEWLATGLRFKVSGFKLLVIDATKISTTLKSDSVDAIVTEPYLGPQRGRPDLRRTVKELETLYQKSLDEFYKILKPGGRVVIIWPVFNIGSDHIYLKNVAGRFRISPPLPPRFAPALKLSNRQTIVYGRVGQKVWREIVILEK